MVKLLTQFFIAFIVAFALLSCNKTNSTDSHSASQYSKKLTVKNLSAGGMHTCARYHDGMVKCFGDNSYGQTGNELSAMENIQRIPLTMDNLPSPVMQISAGYFHTCVVTELQEAYCSGINLYGQIGDGSFQNRFTLTLVKNLPREVKQIVAGTFHTCALVSLKNELYCWGSNQFGQLGVQGSDKSSIPLKVMEGVQGVALGLNHTCAIKAGRVFCWGSNQFKQLGAQSRTEMTKSSISSQSVTAQSVTVMTVEHNPLDSVEQITAGDHHTCALKKGKIFCWGLNQFGQLGNNTLNTTGRAELAFLNVPAKMISAKQDFTCALTNEKEVYCWGNNQFGQLGNGLNENSLIPLPLQDPNLQENLKDVSDLTAGFYHACVIANFKPFCWGANSHGQVGIETKQFKMNVAVLQEALESVFSVMAHQENSIIFKPQDISSYLHDTTGLESIETFKRMAVYLHHHSNTQLFKE